MLRRRGVVAAAIIVFWLVMTGLLLDREVFVPRAELREGAIGSYDTWMGIYLPSEDGSEKKIGYVHSVARREERQGQAGSVYELLFKLNASLLSIPSEIVVDGGAWLPDNEGLREFSFTVASFEEHSMGISGTIENGTLQLEVSTGGESYPLSFPVDEGLLLSGTMGSTTLNLPLLEVGEEVVIDAFDPMTLSSGQARVKCVGTGDFEFEGVSTPIKVLTTSLGGITSTSWVTHDDEVVMVETPLGLILRKVTPLEALEVDESVTDDGFIQRMAIRPAGIQPTRGIETMVLHVSGLPQGVRPPEDKIQRLVGENKFRITQTTPPDPDDSWPLNSPEIYLEGDLLVQVDHPEIVAMADQILEGVEGDWNRSMKLYEWVFANIRKTIVLAFPSAIDVLHTREGDCNEHTVLYAALARAAGIPTRIAIGVVWSDEMAGFYYHAWPEVHVGKWIPMDPTLGQPIADATHVKLLTGNIESWPKLVPYLGQLQMEITEAQ